MSDAATAKSDAPSEMSDAPSDLSDAPSEVSDAPSDMSDSTAIMAKIGKNLNLAGKMATFQKPHINTDHHPCPSR